MGNEIRIYDILLVTSLIGAAWKALFGRDAFTATVFFIAYGLFMAMAWVQLGATDVALAEACIGAGLTGALLINAIQHLEKDPSMNDPPKSAWQRLVFAFLSIAALSGLIGAIIALQTPRGPILPLIHDNLADSGSSHPVTAVLLNFRAFDTWLELGVLLLASVAAISIHRIYDREQTPSNLSYSQSQPRIIARVMLPLLILVGGILLWFGSRAPGGAFQAGALIGAAGILLQISGERSRLVFSATRFRIFLVLGFSMFVVIGLFTLIRGGSFLEYSPDSAGTAILLLEAAATLSIALTLNVMYACSQPWKAESS